MSEQPTVNSLARSREKQGTTIFWKGEAFGFAPNSLVLGAPLFLMIGRVREGYIPTAATLAMRLVLRMEYVHVGRKDERVYRCFECVQGLSGETVSGRRLCYCASCGNIIWMDVAALHFTDPQECLSCKAVRSDRRCRHWHTWGECFVCKDGDDDGREIHPSAP